VGTGIVIIALLVLLFTRGTSTPPVPPSPAPKAEAPAPTAPATPAPETSAVPAPPPLPATTANLKEQLQNVLSTLREAQMQKNIVQFMSVYSVTYPQLEAKRAETLKAWDDFDFTHLVFTIDKVQELEPDNATALVTWYIDAKNRHNQELSSYSENYQVRFVKESGAWRIRSLEEAEH
jgi:hypothetical protein